MIATIEDDRRGCDSTLQGSKRGEQEQGEGEDISDQHLPGYLLKIWVKRGAERIGRVM